MKILMLATVLCLAAPLLVTAGGSKDSKKSDQTAHTSQKAMPVWINTPSADYSEDSYIVAAGSGRTRADAEKDAAASVGRIINQSISAEEHLQSSVSTGSAEQATFATSVSTSTTLREITGISIKENWTAENGTEYALAVLDRSAAGQYYRGKVSENSSKIQDLLAVAKPGTLKGCKDTVSAYELALDNDYYMELLSVIKPVYRKTTMLPYGSSAKVSEAAQKQLSTVSVQVTVDGDTNGQLAAAFTSAIGKTGIKTGGGKDAPYTLDCSVTYETFKMTGSDYDFARYNLSSKLTEKASGTSEFAWTKSGRQGKLSAQEAKSAAVRAAEKAIQEEFSSEFSAMLTK
jgi:hypothetical protein